MGARLAALFLLASTFFGGGNAAAQDSITNLGASETRLFFEGRAVDSRDQLIRLLSRPEAQSPQARLRVLEALLDVCLHSLDAACVQTHVNDYSRTADPVAKGLNDVARLQLARRNLFYIDSVRLAIGSPEALGAIVESPAWDAEFTFDAPLYLRRQVLLANALLRRGDWAGATRAVDRTVSFIASLENPEEDAVWTAHALADSVATLMHIGDSERAYGIYLAGRDLIYRGTAPRSADAVQVRIIEAHLFQERGNLPASAEALEAAATTLKQVQLEPHVHDWLLGQVLTLQAIVCVARQQPDCAERALADHPLKAAFHTARAPADYDELTYLAARALVAGGRGAADPVARAALGQPVRFATPGIPRELVEIYRLAGVGMLEADAAARTAAMRELGARLADYAHAERPSAFGSGYRPGVVDQILILMALSHVGEETDPAGQDSAFALFQLVSRVGPSFDADAQAILSGATDAGERRQLHQALRLRARRDQLERAELARVARRAAATQPAGAALRHDFGRRSRFRRFAQDVEAARPKYAAPSAGVVRLADLQAALAPGEAAILFSPAAGGVAHLCVRRDRVMVKRSAVDFPRLQLDLKLLQAALTAGHAPSETLDAQFPVEASLRARAALLGPVEECLEPGDRIVWLTHPAMVPVPLSVLLAEAPPAVGRGYDLSQARWLVREHAITYGVSANAFIASRKSVRPQPAFDFLGVGDPALEGRTAAGEDRRGIVLRGVRGSSRLADLAPLPETREELTLSARSFQRTRLLVSEAATERAFRRELVGAYGLLSFATHGLIREEIAGLAEPALALTPVASGDPLDDGLLTASEIADLQLAARFVALSACNTANYDLTQFAADLPALASAFAVAGVPSTLATLWPVESDTAKQVVSTTFAALAADPARTPSDALAEAQRRFLAAPPSRAHLHPRFWAPFVVLGDGALAPAASPRPALALEAVEVLTQGGGEVLGLTRLSEGLAARMMSEKVAGRYGSAVRLSDATGERWRTIDPAVGAANWVIKQGSHLLAGGYGGGDRDRMEPVIERFDARSGGRTGVWRLSEEGADFAMGGAVQSGRTLYFTTHEVDRVGRRAFSPRVRTYAVAPGSAPRLLFETRTPRAAYIRNATATVVGGDLFITYSDPFPAPSGPPRLAPDDFENRDCVSPPVTWVERRNAATGVLIASAELPGYLVWDAAAHDGRLVLGGEIQEGCAARAGVVAALDEQLKPQVWHRHDAAGASAVRALVSAPGGRLVAAGWEDHRIDHPADRSAGSDVDDVLRRTDVYLGGLLLVLEGPSRLAGRATFSAGSQIYVSDVEASDASEILVAGAVGGEAAIFRFRRRD